MKIAVDAMGGDFGPRVVVEGAISAAREMDVEVLLVGNKDLIREEFGRYGYNGPRLSIVSALESIHMSEGLLSFRRKKRSSIQVGMQLVRDGEADAFVSAGNTAAVVFLATRVLGLIPGIERPGLSILVPTLTGMTLLIDVGANINCTANHLEQFAVMGKNFMEQVYGVKNPRIGLMSVGEEKSKGNPVTKDVYSRLSSSSLNFVGNVEGNDIYSGRTDVIVSDGFTGNVALKTSEGVVGSFIRMAKREITRDLFAKIGYLLMKRNLKRVIKKMDYAEHGGAQLLGVNGACVVGHGRSNPVAVKNAIRVAKDFAASGVQAKIAEDISILVSRKRNNTA